MLSRHPMQGGCQTCAGSVNKLEQRKRRLNKINGKVEPRELRSETEEAQTRANGSKLESGHQDSSLGCGR